MPGSALLLTRATVIDGVTQGPVADRSILVEDGRIKAIGSSLELETGSGVRVVDASGKYVIPGLLNANVHLLGDTYLENLARHLDRFEDLIVEASQVALKNGLTTVFDTWGPRRFLSTVRDRINAGEIVGSRIYCAGNIIGFDGPLSPDFGAKASDVATAALANRINAVWVENVGRRLMWLTSGQVAEEVRAYIAKGIDFVKFASNEHGGPSAGAFLAFSPAVQRSIVEEAHRAGITAQAHTMTVEGLRMAIDAECDLIQHVNITGPTAIPGETLELLAKRRIGCVVFPWTEKALDRRARNASERTETIWRSSDINVRNLMDCGAPLLMANDGALFSPEASNDPALTRFWGPAGEDRLVDLATGHLAWFKAMEEKGCPPMEMLRAATRNVAVAYRKDKELGTLEPGKAADMLVLDRNPLEAAENYREIHLVIKDGRIVDRDALPAKPILTKPMDPPSEEEACYVPFLSSGRFPGCGCH